MRNLIFLLLLSAIFCLLSPANASANNLNASSASLTGVDLAGGTIKVQFDISWDNSWRSSTNYDAAWIFVKYSTNAGSSWSHATLKTSGTNPANFSIGTGTAIEIVVPADKKGAFIQRSANGTGSVSTQNIQLVWDYAADGVTSAATVRVKAFAIEMCYIPQGAFSLGSGGAETSAFYSYPTTTNPYTVSSEGAITVGTSAGNLYYPSSPYGGDQSGPVPAAFPKGYNAFYIMKYEASQGQYADFLNTITSTQASARYPNSNASYRHTISGSHPNYSASRPDRACNYLSWLDLAAYADWAALRPMSELEFEKACRGTASAVANEYAWGNTTITQATTITGAENGTETVNGNCSYGSATYGGGDGGQGPLRCGIFATGSSTRESAGASYYGVMELSGCLWKRPVTVGNSTGRGFTGLQGDGSLATNGDANVTNWPGTDAVGAGFRGGNWVDVATYVRASDRNYAAFTYASRYYHSGARCVRTSP